MKKALNDVFYNNGDHCYFDLLKMQKNAKKNVGNNIEIGNKW